MSTTSGRLHALDNLRALMMWLGIVLHAAVIYMPRNNPLPWVDQRTSFGAELLVAFIHAFRMPVFFILAGFFVAMLLQSRGPVGMAKHRGARLGIPFAVFWIPVSLATVVLGVLFVHRIERGTWGFDVALVEGRIARLGLPVAPGKPNTMHLWFLWLLLWMSLATAACARFVPARVWSVPASMLRRSMQAPWGALVLAAPLALTDGIQPKGMLYPSGALLPPLAEWAHWGIFFAAGLALFDARDLLFAHFVRRWRAYALGGLVTFLVSGALEESGANVPFAYAYGVTSWLWSFALAGAALQWLPARSRALGYLADSSYWVYIVHLPLTVAFGALLYAADLPAMLKMSINIAATTAVCLATYHALVRFTWLGVLLNGKRHERTRAPGAGATRPAA